MGDAFDETHNDMANLRGEYVQQKEDQVRNRETARQRERRRDTELWEENRLIVSGTIKREASQLFDEEEEIGRTHLLVRILSSSLLCTSRDQGFVLIERFILNNST